MVLIPQGMYSSLQNPLPKQEIGSTIVSLDGEIETLLQRSDLPPDEKAKEYARILKRYLIFREKQKQQKEVPIPVKIIAEQSSPQKESNDLSGVENEIKDEVNQEKEMGEDKEDEIVKSALGAVSLKSRTKVKQLLQYLTDDSSIIGWNERGEVEIEGKKIPGSHLLDLLVDLVQPKRGFDPTGWKFFSSALSKMNVPKNLISNTQRRNFMQTEYNFHPDDDDDDEAKSSNEQNTPEKVVKKRKYSPKVKGWSPYPRRVKSLTHK